MKNEAEAMKMEKQWCLVWGIQWDPNSTWSFWSHGDSRRGGVAILLNPHTITEKYRRTTDQDNPHLMIVESNSNRIINSYGPNNHTLQKEYFKQLQDIDNFEGTIIWGGDFNVITNNEWDRTTNWRSATKPDPSSELLIDITQHWNLLDTLTHVQEAEQIDIEHYRALYHTFGNTASSSRLDRFYIPRHLINRIGWQRAVHPGNYSDHKGFIVQLETTPKQRKKQILYTGETNVPEVTFKRIKRNLQIGLQGKHTAANYQQTMAAIIRMLIRESKNTAMRTKRSHRRKIRRIAKYEGVQPLVIKEKLQRNEVSQSRKRWQRQMRDETQGSEFYKRLQPRMPIKFIPAITKANGIPLQIKSKEHNIADAMAKGWQSIMNPRHNYDSTQLDYTINESEKVTHEENQRLLASITIEELHRSINKMQRNKAGGTDQLNNDFFKDFNTELSPWLLATYNDILKTHTIPEQFSEAKVIAIPKGGDEEDALQYRPIALLQTPYKIFTRILADRLAPMLQHIIHESQHGFLPNRQMEDAIDSMQAILSTRLKEPNKTRDESPIMLSIDYAKAYDSLRREFIWDTMSKMGFHPDFVSLLVALHQDTTVQFEVNGTLSRKYDMTVGIRQGCPLAPLLFIIGTEPLTRLIELDNELKGITLHDGQHSTETKIIGYVDDTILTLQHASMISQANKLLEAFSTASGPNIQTRKCKGVWLNTAITDEVYKGYSFLKEDETFKYLGTHISTNDSIDHHNWSKRKETIAKCLALAAKRTTTIAQRAILTTAIAHPQIRFTANFAHISRPIILQLQRMINNFVWTGQLNTNSTQRGKLNTHIISKKWRHGGLNLVPIAKIINHQLEKKVFRWAMHPPGSKRIVGATLLTGQSRKRQHPAEVLTPHLRPTTRHRSHWNRGKCNIEKKLALHIRRDVKEISKTAAIQDARNWQIRWTTTATATFTITQQAEQQWKELICLRWKLEDPAARSFWEMSLNHNPWFIDDTGSTFDHEYGNHPLNRWIAISTNDNIRFTIKWKHKQPKGSPSWNDRNRLIISIISNIRGLKPHHSYPDNTAIQLLGHKHHRHWTRTQDGKVQSETGIFALTSLNQSMTNLINETGTDQEYVHFRTHPAITKIVIDEIKHPKYSYLKRHYQRVQAAWAHWNKTHDRPTGAPKTNNTLAASKNKLPLLIPTNWNSVWRAKYEDARTKMATYLWFHQAFNVYHRHGIPVCTTCNTEERLPHIMWHCTTAQRLWILLLHLWGIHISHNSELDRYRTHIWMNRAPQTSSTLKTQLLTSKLPSTLVVEVMDDYWTRLMKIGKQHLWIWRNRRLCESQEHNHFQYLNEAHDAVQYDLQHLHAHPNSEYARVYATIAQTMKHDNTNKAQDKLTHDTTHTTKPVHAPPSTNKQNPHRLFFDGGSRGNPGRAGCGCVLQRLQHNQWITVWGVAIPLDHATNNHAELVALFTGLQTITHHRIQHVTIIGDSMLILKQVQRQFRTNNPTLRKLNHEVQLLLSQLSSCQFHHTRRKYNTMADALANHAMDTHVTSILEYRPNGTTATWLPRNFHTMERNDDTYIITTSTSQQDSTH